MRYINIALFLSLMSFGAYAQDYHAIQGSSYAGSLGVANNPSSIVNTPFPWDIEVISFQLATATNAMTITNFSLLSPGKTSYYYVNQGSFNRFADVNLNINLLNARFSINRTHAIAFGANFRSYSRISTGGYNFYDSVKDVREFFNVNEYGTNYNASFNSSSWLEGFITYSQTILDNEDYRLNAGITLKGMRGLSGAMAQLQNGTTLLGGTAQMPTHTLQSGKGEYGYSSNYDSWQNGASTSENLKNFIANGRGSLALDIGFEYLIKPQGVQLNPKDADYYDYDWKIGLSLLDLGFNQYSYGIKSRSFTSPTNHVTDSILTSKFSRVKDYTDFNDSLSTITNNFSALNGKFKIQNPTRLIVNVDRALGNDLYLNGDLSINLSEALSGASKLYVRMMNLVTITPRWETKRWGAYLPVQYNAEGQFLVGGAFKAGPLLVGLHNWANIFSKNKIVNGGGYAALVIRPFKNTKVKEDKRFDCPTK